MSRIDQPSQYPGQPLSQPHERPWRFRPRSRWEWFQTVIIALAMFIAISLPVYVVRTIDANTRFMVEQMVRINSLTIVCISRVEPEAGITVRQLQDCINQGLTVIDPNTPDTP